jgi:hypothetical protein
MMPNTLPTWPGMVRQNLFPTSLEEDHATGERLDRINENENVKLGGECFGYAFVCLTVAIGDRNGSWGGSSSARWEERAQANDQG